MTTTRLVLPALAAAGIFLLATAFPTQRAHSAAGTAQPLPGASGGASSGTETDAGRGKYLTDAGNCMSCHTRPGAAPFSGGVPFVTQVGTIYSSNITPDRESGIGAWTADDLRRAMHDGIAPGGRHLFPAFPYTSFTKISDSDVTAIYAYLRTLQPVRYRPPSNSFLLRQRWGMVLWDALFFSPRRLQPDPRQSAEWNRGAYLVQGLGHCDACHTPRNAFMAEKAGVAYAGGSLNETVPGGQVRRWSAVNLTSSKSGLAAWTVSDMGRYLKAGFSLRGGTFGPMNDVIDNSLRNLNDADIHAMAVYLKSLPPVEAGGASVSVSAVQAGAKIYSDRCQECHMRSGRGGLFSSPPLSASAVVQTPDPASLINVILYGPDEPKDLSFGGWETMKPYKDVLSDAEIAAVCNYVRGSWNNHAGAVTPAQVALQR